MKQWTYLMHTDTVADDSVKAFTGIPDITRKVFRNSKKEAVAVFYDVKNLGHALPVDPGDAKTQGGAMELFTEDKNYHSTFWTAVDFGLVPVIDIPKTK